MRQMYRPMEENRESRNNPECMIFNKGAKTVQWGEDNLFHKWFWGNCIHVQKNEVGEFPLWLSS